ncbi:MAG: Eco57I restriction-modification methylase domain-containing protein, partial [Pirellulaceae bacterium]
MRDAGHQLKWVIRDDDFILGNCQRSLFDRGPEPSFHRVIMNPPYFKLRKESTQAQVMKHVVHGQPNIYSLFMAAAADLLVPGGEMVAITPRSYFNGPYFRKFRKWFFDRLSARSIHVFQSRTEAFKEDAVLQESVILHAEKGGLPQPILLTTSHGRSLAGMQRRTVPYENVIDDRNGDHVVRVTSNAVEEEILAVIDRLPLRFSEAGFEISTGPVVNFRCLDFLRHEQADDTAPLLWMHNVRPFITRFPPKNGKPTHIV